MTLTNLYNARPAWLDNAHKALNQAVADAYGWTDYTPAMSDEEILRRLLALNLSRGARRVRTSQERFQSRASLRSATEKHRG